MGRAVFAIFLLVLMAILGSATLVMMLYLLGIIGH